MDPAKTNEKEQRLLKITFRTSYFGESLGSIFMLSIATISAEQ